MRSAPRGLVVAAFVALVVLLGVNFVAVRFSNRELAPFWAGGARFLVASALLFALVALRRLELPRGRALVGAALFGALAFGGNFSFLYWALVHVGAGLGAVVYALVPLFTLLLAAALRLERLRARPLAGALVAAAGIALAFREQLALDVPAPALLALVGGALCAAASGVVVKRFPRAHPVSSNAVGMAVGAAMLLAVSLAAREPTALPALRATWAAFAWLVLSSTTAFVLMVWVLARWSASAVSYGAVLSPLVTIAVAAALAGEALTAPAAAGALVVLAAAAFAIAPARLTPPQAAPADARTSSAPPPPAR